MHETTVPILVRAENKRNRVSDSVAGWTLFRPNPVEFLHPYKTIDDSTVHYREINNSWYSVSLQADQLRRRRRNIIDLGGVVTMSKTDKLKLELLLHRPNSALNCTSYFLSVKTGSPENDSIRLLQSCIAEKIAYFQTIRKELLCGRIKKFETFGTKCRAERRLCWKIKNNQLK